MCDRVWRHLVQKNLYCLKLYIIKRKFKFSEWICHLFHLVKRENEYFIRGFATHEICIFRFTRWNKWHIHSKNLNILYIQRNEIQKTLINIMYIWKSYISQPWKYKKCFIYAWNWMSSTFSFDFIEPTSDFQTPITFLLVDKTQRVGFIFLVRSQGKFW